MNIDISLWNDRDRMRERIRNLAQLVMSMTAMNGMFCIYQKQWYVFSMNLLFFLFMIPLFVSYSKWRKTPPTIKKESEKSESG